MHIICELYKGTAVLEKTYYTDVRLLLLLLLLSGMNSRRSVRFNAKYFDVTHIIL